MGRLGDLQGQLTKLNADKDATAIELARSEQPGLPRRVAAFDNLYNRVRDTSLKSLYSMGRAYSFWALKSYDELTKVCKLFDPDSIDHATLSSAMTQIEEDCATEIEGCKSSLREAALPDAGADPKVATGIIVTLTKESNPEFIESLKNEQVARFELPATHPSFGGMANVRVTTVRAWIYGMKTGNTGNDLHDVAITHCGPETIITTDKKQIGFKHDPVTVMFRYDASKGVGDPRAIFEGRGGTHDGVILENNYAPIGPFTHWRLAILEEKNPKLDLKGLDKVVMEFHVIAQNLVQKNLRHLKLYWSEARKDYLTTATHEGEEDAIAAGYRFVRDEGYINACEEPNTVPLKMYWRWDRADHFTTATTVGEQSAITAGYRFLRVEGYIYPSAQPNTVPLKSYWNAERKHNFTTATAEGELDAIAEGYQFLRVEGYVNRS